MATPEQLKAAAEKIKKAVDLIRNVKGWGGFFGLIRCVPNVVEQVEAEAAALGIKGADKKELALDILCAMVPDAWIPDWALRPILSWAIEKAVKALKAKFQP